MGYKDYTQSILDDPYYQYNNILLINKNGFAVVLQTANHIELEFGTDDPLFDKTFILIQRENKSFVIHHSIRRECSDIMF